MSMQEKAPSLESCEICPRRCKVNRLRGERGYCGVGAEIIVSHYGPHFGEEPPISGVQGSGNVFFASCNLRCIYCQNHQISHKTIGSTISVNGLADIFLKLQKSGVHNINLVSPTPYVPLIAAAMTRARGSGVTIPFVYNTHAYETPETLQMLEGLVDIYLPDFKYWRSRVSEMLSSARDYPERARVSILEMKRQVGNLRVQEGIAWRGLLIRHLVLPGNLAGSRQVIRWIGETLGRETFMSLMSQYNPLFRASEFKLLNRRIRAEEYGSLVVLLMEEGFENVFVQDLESAPLFVPDFRLSEPFTPRTEGRGQKIKRPVRRPDS
jgi:putative pyruvate formate lyase activating enzyme